MKVSTVQSFLLRHEYLIWILCLCAFLRLPSLLEPYWYGDEGIYLTLGQAVRQGLHLYRDIHDNKPPVIYWMAALTGSVFWFRFFLLAWNSVAIIFFERLSRILFQENTPDGTTKILGVQFPIPRWSTLATVLFAGIPFFAEGAIANGEIFMVMPVILGMWILWRRTTLLSFLLSGLCFSLAFLIKVPALFDACAAGFFFCLIGALPMVKKNFKKDFLQTFTLRTLAFGFAFLLPILLTFGYYQNLGAGKQYIVAAFAQNIGYLSSWATGTHTTNPVSSSGLKTRAILLVVGTLLFFCLQKKNGKQLTFMVCWAILALFGALLSERPYPHYLIQVIPPYVVLAVYAIRLVWNKMHIMRHQEQIKDFSFRFGSIGLCIGVLLVSIFKVHFWYYPLLPYYTNYIQFATKQKSKEQYFSYFDPRLPNLYRLADVLIAIVPENQRIFIWGDVPSLYALTRRLPVGRYTSGYHINDFHGQEETTVAIEEKKPPFIVVDQTYQKPYSELQQILDLDYIPRYTYAPFILYSRVEKEI